MMKRSASEEELLEQAIRERMVSEDTLKSLAAKRRTLAASVEKLQASSTTLKQSTSNYRAFLDRLEGKE